MEIEKLQDIKRRYKIVGNSKALNRALDVACQVASTDLSVLIEGESGVGKEIIPRLIHDLSPRSRNKYLAINCGSIPEGTIDSELFGHEKGSFTGAIGESDGYFGVADGGTIFLDEVGELPLATQARLLRVLETGEYIRVGGQAVRKTNVRIVAATNVNVRKAITEGRFREDLYYRLNTIPIKLPALRDRGDDVILLFRLFAMEMADRYHLPRIELTEGAKQMLKKYKWPGNIRQLKNLTEQMSVLCPERMIDESVLSQYIPVDEESTQLATIPSSSGGSFESERELLYKILYELRGNVNDLRREVNSLRGKLDAAPQVAASQNAYSNIHQDYIEGSNDVHTHMISPMHRQLDYAEAEEIKEPENLKYDDLKKNLLIKALERNGGNRKKAAAELGISDRTLYRQIKQYGINED